ncbi:MAG: 50S ribosomal protein L22 [Actinomycetota bacterium]|nr:50S ribosomal protein L22 [Actinomycetota bacterium]
MPGIKTNERPGTKAVLRHFGMSASKARQVLDLIRGEDVDRAAEILRTTEREAAAVVGKVLASAVANAVHNDGLDSEELYVSACFADEGATLKRWRPRARGRASRIRKRTCHVTIIVSRMPDERLVRRRAAREAAGSQRARRVSESRRRADLAGRLARRRHAQEVAEEEAEQTAGEDLEDQLENEVEDLGEGDTETVEAASDGEEAGTSEASEASEASASVTNEDGDEEKGE